MSATAEQTLLACPPALQGVPPFPAVASRLMRLVANEDGDFSYKDVADLVRTDASFSVEVLRLANSPVFGFRYEIKDIPHAIAVLGLNRLRAIVTTLAMREFLQSGKQHEAARHSWRHNLATALSCEVLARAYWVDGGLGYTAGLLHDVGLLAMTIMHLDGYTKLLNCAVREPIEFIERERAMLGIDHCEAGEWLLTDWELPTEFRDAAAHHHNESDAETSEITRLVQLGCQTATMAGFPVCNYTSAWEPEQIIARLPERVRERYQSKLEDLPMTIATKINSFDCDFPT